MYADDGMFYGDLPDNMWRELPGNPAAGIEINQTKSGFVKKGGKWLKPLKFLGLEYDGEQNKLRAKTRNGSELLFDKEDLVSAYRTHYNEESVDSDRP
jgi:hypothetical protein